MQTHMNIATNIAAANQLFHFHQRRRADGRPAVLPLVRLHVPAVADRSRRAGGRLSLQPGRVQDGRQALREVRRDGDRRDPDVHQAVPQALREGAVPHGQPGDHRRREAAAGSGPRLRGKVRRLSDRGLRHDRAFAAWPPATFPRAAPPAGTDEAERKGTIGRAIPNVCAKIVDPGDGGRPRHQPRGAAVDQGPQRDGRLSQPAGENGRGDPRRLVQHGRHRPRSTTTASSRSPAARAASPRSPAKWCRTSASRSS